MTPTTQIKIKQKQKYFNKLTLYRYFNYISGVHDKFSVFIFLFSQTIATNSHHKLQIIRLAKLSEGGYVDLLNIPAMWLDLVEPIPESEPLPT